ncbi:MAG: hypothetical protein ABIF71_09685 [Planctomycetota bacterium]
MFRYGVCLVILLAAAANARADKTDLALLPSEVNTVISLAVKKPEALEILDLVMPQARKDFEKITAATGLRLGEEVTVVTVGSTEKAVDRAAQRREGRRPGREGGAAEAPAAEQTTPAAPAEEVKKYVVLHGQFTIEAITAKLAASAGPDKTLEVASETYLKEEIKSVKEGALAVCLISKETLVVGTLVIVREMVEAGRKKRTAAGGRDDMIEVLPPPAAGSVLWSVTTGREAQVVDLPGGGGVMGRESRRMQDAVTLMSLGRRLNSWSALGIEVHSITQLDAGGKPVTSIILVMHQALKDAGTANEVANAIRQAQNLDNTGAGRRREVDQNGIFQLLKDAQVAVSGKVLKLTFKTSKEGFEELRKSLADMLPQNLGLPGPASAAPLQEGDKI